MEDLLAEPNGRALAEAFLSIRRRSVRKGLADLVRTIAASESGAGGEDAGIGTRAAAE